MLHKYSIYKISEYCSIQNFHHKPESVKQNFQTGNFKNLEMKYEISNTWAIIIVYRNSTVLFHYFIPH